MYFINSIDNNQIAVYDLNPLASQTIVLVHGWPLSHRIYEYQQDVLVNLGYRVILIDLRGFGNSEVTADGYEYNQMATDLFYVIRTLNLTNFVLVGFSMGGAIVTRYMTLYNGYGVSKLCLLDAAVPSFTKTQNNPYGVTKEYVNGLIQQAYTDRPKLNKDFGNMLFASNPSQELRDYFQDISNSASGIGTIKTAISLRDEDLFSELPQIYVRTGIFHGKKDKICNYGFATIMKRYIPNAELFTFENGGHATFYDELEKFNKTFIQFIQKG